MPKARNNSSTKVIRSQADMDKAVKAINNILRRDKAKGARLYVPELTWMFFLRYLDLMEEAEAQKAAALGTAFTPSLSASDLTAIHGMGEAKSYQLLAAFEIARRFAQGDAEKITAAQDILTLDVIQQIASKQQEHFVCISLNGANEVIEKRIVTVGLLDRSQVHPREVFADVIQDRAAAVILAHNHPSGDLRPSDNDLRIHNQLTESAKILGLRVLDHIIVTRKGHFSFQESGLIQ